MIKRIDTKLITVHWENPLHTWKKYGKKFFKKPEVSISKSKREWHEKPCAWLFDMYAYDVSWKTKYTNIEYEEDPHIEITFFRLLTLYIRFKSPKVKEDEDFDICYWEGILSMMDNEKLPEKERLWKSYQLNIWSNYNMQPKNTIYPYLTILGKHIIDAKLASSMSK